MHVFVNTLTYKNKADLLTKYCSHHRGTEDTELAFLFAHRETTMGKKGLHLR
jgi:hypothetical protein